MTTLQDFRASSLSPYTVVEVHFNDYKFYRVIEAIATKWQWGSQWVIKYEWDNKLNIPHCYQKTRKTGDLLHKIFLLCERTFSFSHNIQFSNACDWFHKICSELCGIELEISGKGIEPLNSSWKKAAINLERQRLKVLKSNKNPFEQYSQAEGLCTLVNKALDLKHQSYPFHEKYWLPFLRAYGAYIEDLDVNWAHGFVENNQYKIRKGKGRSNASIVYKDEILPLLTR